MKRVFPAKTRPRHHPTIVIHSSTALHADKEAEEKKKSHLVTLNEVRSYFFQEGESFPHSYHKRWKIIMHIKAGAGWVEKSAGGRVWGNGIKRIKKWKWKNVPVRDEIAACNFEKWKKRAGGAGLVGWRAAAWENYYYCCKNVKGAQSKWKETLGVSRLCVGWGCVAAAAWRPSPREWGTFYDYYVDIIMLFSRLV